MVSIASHSLEPGPTPGSFIVLGRQERLPGDPVRYIRSQVGQVLGYASHQVIHH